MFRKRKKEVGIPDLLPIPDDFPIGGESPDVPSELAPVESLERDPEFRLKRHPHSWLRTLIAALVAVLVVVLGITLGVQGVYDGLRDRAVANQASAEEHYQLGLARLESGNYELAVAEFELAMQLHPSLPGLQSRLLEAKQLALAQLSPTSEARQDAAAQLYQRGVALNNNRDWAQVVAVLDELQGIEPSYEQDNVTLMLSTAHYNLGMEALGYGQLEEAATHLQAVLDKEGDGALKEDAQEQLNLLSLYTVAMNHWERDWAAAIQALKGLHALAPDYLDVKTRLHNAHIFYAQEHAGLGDWCRASEEYAAAAALFPLETTVDSRDEAAFRCQATAEAPTPVSTGQPAATATPATTPGPPAVATTPPQPAATATAPVVTQSQGRIAFTSYDATRQRYDVYIVDLSQGNATLVLENASHPALAPGGRRLAFRNRDPSHLGLGILDLGTQQVSELTAHVEDSTPTWSPDTTQMLFASNKEVDRRWRLYVISPDATRGEGRQWSFGEMPAWSPDGGEVAYHGCDAQGNNCGVWVMQSGGFDMFLLSTEASDTAPTWSPDGSQVAFPSARNGNWEIYAVDVTTGVETRLTEHRAADVAPAWSPNGKQLAFLSNRGGAWAVHILDLKSGQVRKVIATGDAYPEPSSERISWGP